MVIKIISIFMISFLTTSSYGCNLKALELEADIYASKVWSSARVTENDIKQSLYFLHDTQDIQKNSLKGNSFEEVLEKVTRIQDEKLQNFAHICKNIYQEDKDNMKTLIALSMLLERVTSKYSKNLTRFKQLQKFNESGSQAKDSDENILNIFLNADKGILIK